MRTITGLSKRLFLSIICPLLVCITTLSNTACADGFINPGPIIKKINQISGHTIEDVKAVVQDRAGFLWLGTLGGLYRFNGHEVKRFGVDKNDPNSLPDSNISKMQIDEHNIIWLTNAKGLSRLDPQTEQFTHFQSLENDTNSLESNRIYNIALAPDNKLWLATNKGINLFDRKTLKNQRLLNDFSPDSNNSNDNVNLIFQDDQQRVWFARRRLGLSMHDLKSKQTIHFNELAKTDRSYNSHVAGAVTQRSDGSIWIGNTVGVSRFEPDSMDFSHFAVPLNAHNNSNQVSVKSLYEDHTGRLWIGSFYNGLSILLPGSTAAQPVNQSLTAKQAIGAQFINTIFEDSSKTLWFGSAYNGVYRLSSDALQFDYQFTDQQINTLFTDPMGRLWLGTNRNLYQYNQQLKQFTLAKADIGFVSQIVSAGNDKLILALSGVGLMLYDVQTGQTLVNELVELQKSPVNSTVVQSLASDTRNNLWFGLFDGEVKGTGLYGHDRQTRKVVKYLDKYTFNAILPLGKKLLLGTRNKGAYLYDPQSKALVPFQSPGRDSSHILSLYQDSQSRIWVASETGGLAQANIAQMTLNFVGDDDNPLYTASRTITEDQQGILWIGTAKGIVRFDANNLSATSYSKNQGLRVSTAYPLIAASLPSGELIIGNQSETVRFSPQRLHNQTQQTTAQLPVVLSDFRLFNRSLSTNDPLSPLSTTINQTQSLTLSHQQYWFSLAFASSNYSQLDNIRYAYKLEGFNDDWIETDNSNRIATFTSLPAKNYTLKIKTKVQNGPWSDTLRAMKITITPPWWQSWQANLIYAIVIFGGCFGLYRVRTQSLIRRAEKLEQGVKERTATINTLLAQKERMFANISHEFKTPLTLILSPLESINDKTPSSDVTRKVSMMKRNGQRLLRMVEQLLELSRLETLDTGKRHRYSIKDALELLLTSFQPLLDSKNLTLNATKLDDAVVCLKADALEMILTNLLSNAIKYTKENGNITLSVKADNKNVVLSVQDTGIGISPDNIQLVFNRFTRANEEHDESIPGAGIGLALVKELVENDKGTISLESEVGKGSTFIVTFPISYGEGETVETIGGLSTTSQNEIDALLQSKVLPGPDRDSTQQMVSSNKPCLLLIDDNADMLTLLTDTLQDQYHCLTAKNGEIGLTQAQENIPDLIICDVMMPGISGYEVAKQLKLNELTCHIPVVLLTAKGDMDSRMEGWKQDIDDYLAKPFHPQELHLRIQSLLSIRHILKKRFNKEMVETQSTPASPAVPAPVEVVMSDKDVQFIERFKKVIEENFQEPEFSREQAAGQMLISDRQLHRKLSALLEDTFTEYLRSFRLERAVQMLTTGLQIGQISDQVGFTSMAYFSKCFKAQFNKTPKQYQKELTH